MSMQHGPGRTYRYLAEDFPVAFPFGHGLSYTTFALQWPSSAPSVTFTGAKDSTKLLVDVANTGKVAGDEVVLVYAKAPRSIATLSASAPIAKKTLIAFQRVHVEAGGMSQVSFDISAEALGLADETGAVKLHAGDYKFLISRGHGEDLEVPTSVTLSSPVVLKTFRKWWSDETQVAESVFV